MHGKSGAIMPASPTAWTMLPLPISTCRRNPECMAFSSRVEDAFSYQRRRRALPADSLAARIFRCWHHCRLSRSLPRQQQQQPVNNWFRNFCVVRLDCIALQRRLRRRNKDQTTKLHQNNVSRLQVNKWSLQWCLLLRPLLKITD